MSNDELTLRRIIREELREALHGVQGAAETAVTVQEPTKLAYSVKQAADACGIAESKVRALIRDNKLAAKYAGKDVLITRQELERWLDSLPHER